MPATDKTKDYLQEVCSHIRWKRAHEPICKELGAHIEDQQEAFIVSGMDESAAVERAVEEMGDAAVVGSLLDRSYRPRPAWSVIAITAALMITGYFSRLYIISRSSGFITASPLQGLLWLLVAVAALIAGYFLDFTILVKYRQAVRVIYYAILTIITLNAYSFYTYTVFRYGHFLLMLSPVVYASIICGTTDKGFKGFAGCWIYLIISVFSGFVVSDLGTAMICWCIGLLLLTYAIIKGFFKISKLFGLLTAYFPPALFFAWVAANSRILHRFWSLFDADASAEDIGYFNIRVRDFLINARVLGTGSYTYEDYFLTSADPDYVLTFLTHELGWASFIVIAALFVLFFIMLAVFISKQKNMLGRMVSMAVFLVLFAEFTIYIMNNLGFGFFGSMSLPLVSYGNTELIINSFLIGLMLSVFRTGDLISGPKADGGVVYKANNGPIGSA